MTGKIPTLARAYKTQLDRENSGAKGHPGTLDCQDTLSLVAREVDGDFNPLELMA